MAYSESVKRRKTREVGVGPLVIGGENPIWVQSMTATHTEDIEGTVSQIHELEEAGCELVRVTVPRLKALENLKISGEISNMKFDIIIRPFLCPVPLQKVFRFEFLNSHGTQNRLKDCSTSV